VVERDLLFIEQTTSVVGEDLPLWSQAHWSRAAYDQGSPDSRLEHSDDSTEAGLTDVESGGRATVVSLFAEHEQAANRAQIEIAKRPAPDQLIWCQHSEARGRDTRGA